MRTIEIINTTFKRYFGTFLIYCAIGLLFLFLYVSIFPSLATQQQSVDQLMKSLSPTMLKAFNIDVNISNTLTGYLSSKHFALMWPILGVFMVIAYGSYALAGEIEKGTMALFLSAPVSRTQIYVAKYATGILGITLFVVLTALITIPIAQFFDLSVPNEKYYAFAFGGGLFLMAVYSMAYMLSALFSERGKASGIAGLVFLGMYIANVMSGLLEKLENLKYFSFLYYFDANQIFIRDGMKSESIVVFICVTIVTFFVGLYCFNKRDIVV